ncbi:hypothetical protein TCE0_015r02849 [Talaromyces pinophilus]|uniref:DUF803 domain membrane protein n=1 Tax=Talaromyces pinophilus TaxID=128442 RepID=A0A6V8H278_TALPI|nr:hypothetical protein TCE0_015r02849 [Talaromyces pinophilus]
MQRYAHVRIEQKAEGERVRLRSRRRLSTSTYGSVEAPYRDEPDYEIDNQPVRSRNGRYRSYNDDESRDGNSENLDHSVLSDNTLRPDDKNSVHGDRVSYLHSPYWWAGIVLMTLGEMGNFLAYGFAPASIVSPLGVVALISNCIIAPFLLKEKFRPRDFWGVLIAIAGAVVVVLSAETSETKIGPHDIWVMITKWEFEVYMGITAALIMVLMYLSEKYGGRTILIDLGLVGLFGAYTALSTKGVASLLSFTLWHVITFPISYLLVAVLVTSALMQVRYINRALQRFDSTQVIPTQFVLFTLSVIIGSAVLYRDFESATLSRSLKFVGGCALTFLGVYFITSGRVRNDDDISYGDEDEEEAVGFLNEERYRDSIDQPSPLDPRPQRTNNISGPLRRDSVRSATSEGQSLSTPKGLLSPVGSDHEGSFSEDSLSQELTTPSPPLRSHSLTDNPWASPGHTGQTPSQHNPLAQESTPATPPSRQTHIEQTPPLLFKFPVAPTHDNHTSSANNEPHGQSTQSLQLPSDAKTPTGRRRSTPRTPQSNARNSVTLRLTPSPLIAPLSSTLSAVVADSLLRGEGTPAKHGRSKSVRARRLAAAPLIPDGTNSDGHHLGHDTDLLVGGHHNHSSAVTVTPGSSRFNSSSDVRPTDDRENTDAKSNHDEAATMRIRSFSDSISGHLAWLGGTLIGSKRSSRPTLPSQSGENEPDNQDAHS